MIGVIIPAHNEERELEQCLTAIRAAAGDAALGGEAVHVIVVLDGCSDGSRAIVERHALHSVDGGCVSAASRAWPKVARWPCATGAGRSPTAG